MNDLEIREKEYVWTKICFENRTLIIVGSIYRPNRIGNDPRYIFIFGDLKCYFNDFEMTFLQSSIFNLQSFTPKDFTTNLEHLLKEH